MADVTESSMCTRSGTRIVYTTRSDVCDSESESCSASDLAPYVLNGNFPLIVKLILSFLPAKVLNTAARQETTCVFSGVCKQWRQIACKINSSRQDLCWFMAVPGDRWQEEESTCLAEQIKTYIENLWCQPQTVITFLSSELYEEKLALPSYSSRPGLKRAAKCGRADLEEYIVDKLPKSCSLLGAVSDGAVGTKWKSASSIEVESERALTMLVLPKLPGIDIFSFTMDIYASETNWHMLIDGLQSSDVNISAISSIPSDKNVKAVLFFCDEPFCPPEIGHSILTEYKNAVVAGGYVEELVIKPMSQNETPQGDSGSIPTILCVAFCGDNLRVSSVIIRESVNTLKEAEKQIIRLKTPHVTENNSFAFMFSCVGRGEGLYFKKNVESDVFRKIFPNTPLFGFFGNGEIGFNHFPEEMNSSEREDQRILPKLYHAYTTVICLISIV